VPDALEVINSVLSQHFRITENIKTTGDKMNDIDAVFGMRVAAYKTANSAFSVSEFVEKRAELLKTVDVLEEGLKKHFTYEEKALPLVLGELLLKDILHDHKEIFQEIEEVKKGFASLEKLDREALLSKRLELVTSVNDLSDKVINHAQYEEKVLNSIKKAFEEKPTHKE
jgi:hypothetical protein